MKKFIRKALGLALISAMLLMMAGCGASEEQSSVNIGITDSLGGVNSLTVDQTWINKYAIGLQFLPLVDLDGDLNFVPMLADSITTDDNINFTVHINDDAKWSDGTPVTAEDVEFTFLRLASPVIGNPTMLLYAFEGVGDDGFVEEGADSVEGVKVIDEKTIQFTTKYPIAMTTFENTYAFYIHTLPRHIIKDYNDTELMTLDWFNHPDVVN